MLRNGLESYAVSDNKRLKDRIIEITKEIFDDAEQISLANEGRKFHRQINSRV